MAAKFQARLPYLILALLILALDRWTKWLIDTGLNLNQTIQVIDGFFNITYVQNTGIAFGILNSISSPVKATLLSILTMGAVTGVIVYSFRSPVGNRLLQTALTLILAGALGNLYDRVSYGYVIDFLELYYGKYHWPSFNVADTAISIGVAMLVLEIIRNDGTAKTPSKVSSGV